MENNITIIRDGTKIQVDYILQYERIIGYDVNHNPKYRDISFNLYIEDEHFSVYFWIDNPNQTITINLGIYNIDEPLVKEVADVLVDRLNLKGYTIKYQTI